MQTRALAMFGIEAGGNALQQSPTLHTSLDLGSFPTRTWNVNVPRMLVARGAHRVERTERHRPAGGVVAAGAADPGRAGGAPGRDGVGRAARDVGACRPAPGRASVRLLSARSSPVRSAGECSNSMV